MGQRVSGCVGPLVINLNIAQKRKVWEHLFGNVVEEYGPKHYKVQFDNMQLLDVSSNTLQVEKSSALLPPGKAQCPPQHCQGVFSFSDLLKNQKVRKRILMKSQMISEETPRQRKGRAMSCLRGGRRVR